MTEVGPSYTSGAMVYRASLKLVSVVCRPSCPHHNRLLVYLACTCHTDCVRAPRLNLHISLRPHTRLLCQLGLLILLAEQVLLKTCGSIHAIPVPPGTDAIPAGPTSIIRSYACRVTCRILMLIQASSVQQQVQAVQVKEDEDVAWIGSSDLLQLTCLLAGGPIRRLSQLCGGNSCMASSASDMLCRICLGALVRLQATRLDAIGSLDRLRLALCTCQMSAAQSLTVLLAQAVS